jgi:nicotinamide-nucleotide amidase
MPDLPIARVLAFGDELLLGRTTDTNSAWLAGWLGDRGFRVDRLQVAGDRQDEEEDALAAACAGAALVLVTGGLGPTDDDRTRHALAEVMGVKLKHHGEAWRQVRQYYRIFRRGAPPASNRRQALVPAGADILANDRGTAPGLLARVADTWVACFPGVPHEMQAMAGVLDGHLPRLVRGLKAPAMGELYLAGIGESDAQERIAGLMSEREPQVGITASELGHLCLRVVGSPGQVARRLRELRAQVKRWLLPAPGVADSLIQVLAARGATVTAAESCTAGHITTQLAAVPGASRVLHEGFITYHERAKQRRLAVPEALIAEHGVVSEAVASAMAAGAAAAASADLAIATTGLAGPSGGDAVNPVGTVWVAVAWRGRQMVTRRLALKGSRTRIQARAAAQALALAWQVVAGRC